MSAEAKTRQAELEARLKEIETLKSSVSSDNSAAIESIVQTRLAELAPQPTQPTDEQIAEAAKAKIVEKEAEFASQREEAIKTAVKEVTEKFETQLQAAKEEITKLQAAGGGGSTGGEGPSEEQIKQALEGARKGMEEEFEKVKKTMLEESTKREKEITERLSAEIQKLQASAASSSSTAPPPNVDAIVQQKVAAIEKERSVAQQQAIAKAVNEALNKQKATNDQILSDTKVQIEKQGAMKNNLLNKSVATLREKLALYQKQLTDNGITPAVPPKAAPVPASSSAPKPAPAPTPSTSTSVPTPAPSAPAAKPASLPIRPPPASTSNGSTTTPASLPTAPASTPANANRGGGQIGRGRGAARGARGAGPANRGGRGGAAATSPPVSTPTTPQAKPPVASGASQPASPGLALRGAARGGVLGQLLNQGGLTVAGAAAGAVGQAQSGGGGATGAAKRQRDSQGEGEGDPKRPKGGA